MSESVTKKAYARGIGEFLQREGAIAIPSAAHLKEACDKTAGFITVEPMHEAVPTDDAVKVAQALIAYNDALGRQGKLASYGQVEVLGHNEATAVGDLIEKVAREVLGYDDNPANTSSTVTGKRQDQENLLSDSQQAEAVLDSHRGEGYAVVGQGNANFSEPQKNRTGSEQPHPQAPKPAGGASTNSVIQASKAASIMESLRKMAMGDAGYNAPASPTHGSTILGGDPDQQNLESDSVQGEAMMDVADRPENYAVVGQGNANFTDTPPSATTGSEEAHPKGPAPVGGASGNSVTEVSGKTAADRFNRFFQETAREIFPHLPQNMPLEQKTAAVKECMRLEPHEQRTFLTKVAQAFAQPPRNTVSNVLENIGLMNQG